MYFFIQAAMKSANYSYYTSSRPSSPKSLENKNISDLRVNFWYAKKNIFKTENAKNNDV